MVYCVNCGAQNSDDAVTCTHCGKSIMEVERGSRRHGDEVFATRHHWGGVFAGLFIIIIGLLLMVNEFVPLLAKVFWPLVLIFVGAAIILNGLYRHSRR